MPLDEVDRNWIRDEIRRTEDHLVDQIKTVGREITTHMSDRFAHGWDHTLIDRSQVTIGEWNTWRDGVNRWRWMITGALILTSVEVPIVGAIVVAFIHR